MSVEDIDAIAATPDGNTSWGANMRGAFATLSDEFAARDMEINSIAAEYFMADHVVSNMQKGTFTPQTDKVLVEVGLSGLSEGAAHISAFFAWNQSVSAGTDLLTGQGFLASPYIANTSYKTLGPASGPGNIADNRRKFLIEGLTPGTPMEWQVDVGATGYYENISPGDFPNALALSENSQFVYVTSYSSNRVSKYRAGNEWAVSGVTELLAEWTVNTAFGVATHPTNPDVVYVSDNGAGAVRELDADTGSVLRSFTVTNPQHLCVSRDGTTLFVGNGSNGLVPVTISDGTVGSAVTVGGGGGTLVPVAVGNYVIVPCVTGNVVARVDVASKVVTTIAAGTPKAVAVADPDTSTTFLMAERNVEQIREVDLATMALTASPVIPSAVINGVMNDIAFSPSGKSVLQVSDTRTVQTYVWPSKSVIYESTTGGGSFIKTDRYGDLWILNALTDEMHHYHSALLRIDPADDFWGGYADVILQSVHAPQPA